MTLKEARTRAFVEIVATCKRGMILDWFRITQIKKKVGCTKYQLDQIIEELRENGELRVGVYKRQVVVLVDTAKKSVRGGQATDAFEGK